MKKIALFLILFSFLVTPCYSALTPAERAIVTSIGEVNKRQKIELEDVRAKLVWTHKELTDVQPKIDQIGKERDQYKSMWEKEHEKVLKQESAILRRNIIILLLGLGLAFMIIWKFKLYRFIPGLGLAP